MHWRLYLLCISALPVMLVSAKNNSNTDFPRVISLFRIRLRSDFFSGAVSNLSPGICHMLQGEEAVSVSPYWAVWNSVSLAAFWDHTQGGMVSGPHTSAFHFGLAFFCKGSTMLAWRCWWSKEHLAPGKVFPFLLVSGAGFVNLQGKLVMLNKELLYLDDIFLSLWLLVLSMKHFQIRYKEGSVGFFRKSHSIPSNGLYLAVFEL